MSKQVLLNHLTNDPDNRGYSNMTAAEVAADLKVKRHDGDFEIGAIGIIGYGGQEAASGLFSAIDLVAPSNIVINKVKNIMDNFGTLNLNDPAVSGFMQQFVGAGLMQQSHMDSILAIKANQISDEQKYNLGNVKEGQVLAVRGY